MYARLRQGLIILPVVLILLWVLYQYMSGVYLRDDILDAVEHGNLGDVRALIMDGAPVDARHNNGTSLLHRAIEMGHIKVVPLLIKEGAEVNAVDHRGITPIHLAAGKVNTTIVKLLIQSGADPGVKSEDYGLPLHWAASKGWRDIATRLIYLGADTEVQDRMGNTALHKAARHGYYDLSTLLIEHDADVNVSTPGFHVTPLHQAVRYGHEKIVRLLLNSGAMVNAYSKLYGPPLHWVAESGHRGIAEVLLEHGASTITLDSHRLTPADRAREEGQKDLVALFNTVNGSGKSGMPDFTRSSENHTMDEECVFPRRMHSTSRMVLADYLDGQTPTAEFLRLFSLTNSRYLELGNCLVRLHLKAQRLRL